MIVLDACLERTRTSLRHVAFPGVISVAAACGLAAAGRAHHVRSGKDIAVPRLFCGETCLDTPVGAAKAGGWSGQKSAVLVVHKGSLRRQTWQWQRNVVPLGRYLDAAVTPW